MRGVMRAFRKGRAAPAVVALAAMGLFAGVACGGGGSSAGPTTTASGGGSGGGSRTVTATETEYKIALSQTSFSPGTYTFTAVNKGKVAHSLEINGPGVQNQRIPGNVSPGQSRSLTATLKAGSYEIWCPVDGHKGLGMDVKIQVGGGAMQGSTGQTSTTGGSSTTTKTY
jgi:plastocyanin